MYLPECLVRFFANISALKSEMHVIFEDYFSRTISFIEIRTSIVGMLLGTITVVSYILRIRMGFRAWRNMAPEININEPNTILGKQ